MRAIEREILRELYHQAALRGFQCVRFACTPATGEHGDEIANPSLDDCIAHARAWDSNSVIEFRDGAGSGFWVLLVWGNGEDLISDYTGDNPDAGRVTDAVAQWIEA